MSLHIEDLSSPEKIMNFKVPVCLSEHFFSEVKNCNDHSDGGHGEIQAVIIGRKIETTLVVTELIYPPQEVFNKGNILNHFAAILL